MSQTKLMGELLTSGELVNVGMWPPSKYQGNPNAVDLVEHPEKTGVTRPWGYDQQTSKAKTLLSQLLLSPAGDMIEVPPDGTTVVPVVVTGPPGGHVTLDFPGVLPINKHEVVLDPQTGQATFNFGPSRLICNGHINVRFHLQGGASVPAVLKVCLR